MSSPRPGAQEPDGSRDDWRDLAEGQSVAGELAAELEARSVSFAYVVYLPPEGGAPEAFAVYVTPDADDPMSVYSRAEALRFIAGEPDAGEPDACHLRRLFKRVTR